MAARAETWLVLFLAFALLALWYERVFLAKALILVCFLSTLALTIFPWGSALIAPLESQYPARPKVDHVDTIIVLGGDEDLSPYRRWGGLQVNAAGERFIEGLALARRLRADGPALAAANDTPFGLSAGIATTSLKFATHFRRHSQVGMVMVNLPTAGVDYHVPFGGRKGSSYGPREQGRYAAEFYTTVKTAYTQA